jgi:hypothetical protein
MKPKLFKSGDTVTLTLTFEAELVCDSDDPIPEKALLDMIMNAKGFCDAQIVVGKILPDSKDDHDTELLFSTLSFDIR